MQHESASPCVSAPDIGQIKEKIMNKRENIEEVRNILSPLVELKI